MAVLRIVDRIDRPIASRTPFCSVLISLLVHAALAAVLWCLVYANLRREPISLTASASSASPVDVRLEFVKREGSVKPSPALEEFSPTLVPVNLWVSQGDDVEHTC